MEVQVQAFAYATNDAINDMTFYRYKLLNKATEDIGECYFSIWIDPDLGCYQTTISVVMFPDHWLMFIMKMQLTVLIIVTVPGTPTYCATVPILGMDYFRGPQSA
jgi:hypothetical protein